MKSKCLFKGWKEYMGNSFVCHLIRVEKWRIFCGETTQTTFLPTRFKRISYTPTKRLLALSISTTKWFRISNNIDLFIFFHFQKAFMFQSIFGRKFRVRKQSKYLFFFFGVEKSKRFFYKQENWIFQAIYGDISWLFNVDCSRNIFLTYSFLYNQRDSW